MKHFQGFLSTPPLWFKQEFGITQFEFPEIDLENFEPKPIPENLRLGHQVEYIFKQLIEFDSTYTLLANNFQLKRNKITIGELDFLLRHNETQKIHHVELTYKFYILDPTISDPIHRAMGPNRKDLFFAKMEKTRDQHFPLLHSPEGKELLSNLDISKESIVQSCCYLGQLFKPYDKESPSIAPLNTNCIVGFWLNLFQLEQSKFQECEYFIPSKAQWVAIPHIWVDWTSYDQCLPELKINLQEKRSPMLWIKYPNNRIKKCFLVWW